MPTRTSPHGPIGFEARQGAARPPRPVTTRFISLLEFFWLAEQVTVIDADVLKLPGASISRTQPSTVPKRASGARTSPGPDRQAPVLACQIAWNHPLPDGNKRPSWACLVMSSIQRGRMGPRSVGRRSGGGGGPRSGGMPRRRSVVCEPVAGTNARRRTHDGSASGWWVPAVYWSVTNGLDRTARS